VTLPEVLQAEAAELGAVEGPASGGGLEWRRGERIFAASSATAAEFRLAPVVAAAALRTPDTSGSSRGPDWVTFAPVELDEMALDRATAWFASAWRLAAD
jgi:hypothetical protein